MNEPTKDDIGEVLTAFMERADRDLMALTEDELHATWTWRWDDRYTAEWNIYQFSECLERHKRNCRRWEERHNGTCCVVERVRDKYLKPRIGEFIAAIVLQPC
jgi:hypothetical protein